VWCSTVTRPKGGEFRVVLAKAALTVYGVKAPGIAMEPIWGTKRTK
jgi:hypothetical protein